MKMLAMFQINEDTFIKTKGGSSFSAFKEAEKFGLFLEDHACCKNKTELDALNFKQIYCSEEDDGEKEA